MVRAHLNSLGSFRIYCCRRVGKRAAPQEHPIPFRSPRGNSFGQRLRAACGALGGGGKIVIAWRTVSMRAGARLGRCMGRAIVNTRDDSGIAALGLIIALIAFLLMLVA